MKKMLLGLAVAIFTSMVFCSCSTVNYINTAELKSNYEKKINHTPLLAKALFKRDKVKKDTYENVTVYMNENEVKKDFEVVAYGSYTPLILPLIRPERPRCEKNLLWRAARKARKLGANGAIIDNKNDFRVIKTK